MTTLEKLQAQIKVTEPRTGFLILEAAKEIERLESENTLLKSALIEILQTPAGDRQFYVRDTTRIAQEALNEHH